MIILKNDQSVAHHAPPPDTQLRPGAGQRPA